MIGSLKWSSVVKVVEKVMSGNNITTVLMIMMSVITGLIDIIIIIHIIVVYLNL